MVETFLTIGQYPCVVASELVLQTLTNHLVCTQQVGRRDTLAIGRIGDDDTLVFGLCEVFEILLSYGDVTGQTGCLDIEACCVDCLDVDVIAVDVVIELALLRVVIIYFIEQVSVEVRPLLKGS